MVITTACIRSHTGTCKDNIILGLIIINPVIVFFFARRLVYHNNVIINNYYSGVMNIVISKLKQGKCDSHSIVIIIMAIQEKEGSYSLPHATTLSSNA